jgi:hypothetical protein
MNSCALAGIFSRSAGLKMRSCTPLIIPHISAIPIPNIIDMATPETTSVDPADPSDLLMARALLVDFAFLSIYACRKYSRLVKFPSG